MGVERGQVVRAGGPSAKTGPLPQVRWQELDTGLTLERHLPKILLAMFGALLALQLYLHL